jgi:hypothetical protein
LRLINKHVGFDYSKPKSWMLYFRLWDAVVEWALANGFASIHSGQTAYRAKMEMGHKLIPLVNYVRHRNPLLHAIYHGIAGSLDWSKVDEGLAIFLKAHPDEHGRPIIFSLLRSVASPGERQQLRYGA